ncbi:MAG: hypothetical protein JW902_10170 [Syntrophaceae bacterium]|nr:hypothetical protein [Syntrophaceae bacterium]
MLKNKLKLICDSFSRRPTPLGYAPDTISDTLKNRILLLYRDVLSGKWPVDSWSYSGDHTFKFWEEMGQSLQHLYGRPVLSNNPRLAPVEDVCYFVTTCETAHFLDFIEQTFKIEETRRILNDENVLVEAINEIFRVESSPYHLTSMVKVQEPNPKTSGRFSGGMIIRTVAYPRVIRAEDEVTHSEAVGPALSTLMAPHFEAANLEFRDALDEYRKGHYGDCMTKCSSAFESVMKVLCKRNGWPVNEDKDAAAALLKMIISKTTLNPFFEQPLMLIATMRNRLSSSHGGGTVARMPERHIAQYAITSTAAAIVLLVHEAGG